MGKYKTLDEMKRLEEDAKIRIDYIRSMVESINKT
jgi:hypothetical protein